MTREKGPQRPLNLVDALTRAYQHWNAGNAEQAELLCQQVMVVWPDQPDALHLLGIMAHAYGNHDLAIDYVRRACLSPRAPGMFFRNLTEMCRQRGLLLEGEAAGRRAIALEPNSADCWNNLGIVLQEIGKIDESDASLRRALELNPNDPKTLSNIGNTCRLAGRMDEAEKYYRRALELDPESAQTYNNLAALVAARGNLDLGVEYAREALVCEPQYSDAYLTLSDIESVRFNYKEALRWIDALLAYAQNHVGALGAKARLLRKCGRCDEALVLIQRAVMLAPKDGSIQYRLGEVLQALGQTEAALDAYRAAADTPGRHVEDALIDCAITLWECGRQQEARVAFEQIFVRFPGSLRARVAHADCKSFVPGDPDIEALEVLADAQLRLDVSQQIGVHFALSKAYFDICDGAHAFAHLESANRLKRGTFNYDSAHTSTWLRQIAEAFPAPLLPLPGALTSERPVFIVGMPRSGSTLVEQILASHPNVAAAGELSTLRLAVEQSGDFPFGVDNWTDEVLHEIGRAYRFATASLAPEKSRLIDKMPSNFLYLGIIARVFPGGRIIHCRRDPVDTCLSCYARNFSGEQPFCYDQRELGQFYRDYHRLMAHWRTALLPGSMIEVDYEAVVSDLEGQSRRLIAFLGLDWHDACLDFHQARRVVRTASTAQVRQPIYRNAVGRWRAYADHLAPLIESLGDLVE